MAARDTLRTLLDLHRWEAGSGDTVLCVHESAATGEAWRPLARAIAERARTVAYDRRGWGRSGAPEPYLGTTVEEHSEDAARLIEQLEVAPALLCGAGIGAVIALDLLVRRPELARGALLVEPPLLAFVPAATEAISADVGALREAVAARGPRAGVELYLSGSLRALGPGAERLPAELAETAAERPLSLFAELGAVPAWRLPLAELATLSSPVAIAVAGSTSELVRRASVELCGRIPGAELHELESRGLPQLDAARELAELLLELA
jgi:pimeloyl-ACP methyl ester carboxylesterase